jgi:hypothetical protein
LTTHTGKWRELKVLENTYDIWMLVKELRQQNAAFFRGYGGIEMEKCSFIVEKSNCSKYEMSVLQ